MGYNEKDQNGGAWSCVPVWDGFSSNLEGISEMKWWTSCLDLDATEKFNLAARWLLRQSGVVRRRGEERVQPRRAGISK